MGSRGDPLSRARELSLAGLLGALGLLLPIGFHMLGWAGPVFLPMHLPILVGGFVLSAGPAATLGLVVPLLSAALTGMPPIMPVAPLISVELMVKAGVASTLYRRLRAPMWVALPLALIADWAVLAVVAMLLGGFFGIEEGPLVYVWGVIVMSLPGTALQVVAVPLAVRVVEQRVPRLARGKRSGPA